MELPVLIERLPDGVRYAARLGSPFNLSAEGSTADEAERRLVEALRLRLQQGSELRSISLPPGGPTVPRGGWLPDDELTREWLGAVQQLRREVDEADRRRLWDAAPEGQAAS